jgi:hypothetical protein
MNCKIIGEKHMRIIHKHAHDSFQQNKNKRGKSIDCNKRVQTPNLLQNTVFGIIKNTTVSAVTSLYSEKTGVRLPARTNDGHFPKCLPRVLVSTLPLPEWVPGIFHLR